ncbi:MAG: transposase family protein [Polyangiaceae bacterium]|nr:transposase family protein [Polyangiaceae bacterium]
MNESEGVPMRMRWARLRFQIIGPLFAAPPDHGELSIAIEELAKKQWRHPTTGECVKFGASTIERWYYQAKSSPVDTMESLARKVRGDAGKQPCVHAVLKETIRCLHQQFPWLSFQLHYDNIVALAEKDPTIHPIPSYSTICRYMKSQGLLRAKSSKIRQKKSNTGEVYEVRETRSFEVEHVNGLWHLDFHECSRSLCLPSGERHKPVLLCVLDDRSRLVCHAQWYLAPSAETLIHGLCQAIMKRGLPWALYADNGGAMIAAETREGLLRLGVVYDHTRPYGPEQNAKQEVFWAQVEGRLMAMLRGEPTLTLALLNQATQAWVEQEYNRAIHSETKQAPIARFLDGPNTSRPSPEPNELRQAFRRSTTRAQRQGDGTLSLEGIRFEIPARYRPLKRVHVRYAKWDLSSIELCDERTGKSLCTLLPLDKAKNADRQRRVIQSDAKPTEHAANAPGVAPLLQKYIAEYAATGLPPAYLAHEEVTKIPEENT